MESQTKVCTCCGIEKPLTEFYRDRRVKKDGLTAQCKNCLDAKKRVYRQNHKEQRSEYERNRRLTDSEWRKTTAERNKRYFTKLKEEGGPRLEHHKNRVKAENKKLKTQDPRYRLWYGAKARAQDKNLEFNIDLDDIIIPEKCPILNIPLCVHEEKAAFDSYSLDRIDSSKGYVKGNVAVISRLANTMKNDATREELELFCKNILNYVDRKDIVRTAENKESVDLEDKEPLG